MADQSVPVVVEPPKAIQAIVLRSGQSVRSVAVTDGKLSAPPDLPLPWSIGLVRYVAADYTAVDLAQGKPLVLREIGSIAGRVLGDAALRSSPRLLLYRRGAGTDELPLSVNAEGEFQAELPPGIYDAAVISTNGASRILRSIVVPPGARVGIGDVRVAKSSVVGVEVKDKRTGAPLAGAKVKWAPPNGLNSEVAAELFARVWSGNTNGRGRFDVLIGPTPITGRWYVDAPGYSSVLTENAAASDPDKPLLLKVQLPRVANLTVQTALSREFKAMSEAKLVLGHRDPRSDRFVAQFKKTLSPGDTLFTVPDYGAKRLWIEDRNGRPIWYRDFSLEEERQTIVLAPFRVDLFGKVTRRGEPVGGATIRVSDPLDPRFTLGSATSDDAGHYLLPFYDSGTVAAYANGGYVPGHEHGQMVSRITPNGSIFFERDFELAEEGVVLQVVDRSTDKPVIAAVERVLELNSGQRASAKLETDAYGVIEIAGFGAGKAHLVVTAPRYASQRVDVDMVKDPTPLRVRLERAEAVHGRVVDLLGIGISGAIISAGYNDAMGVEPSCVAMTDADGAFSITSPMPPGTTYYVVAGGYALGISQLRVSGESFVRLPYPTASRLFVLPNGAQPDRLFMFSAAPADDELIPYGVLHDLAEANHLTEYQLLGNAADGHVPLPQYLSKGTYDIYLSVPSKDGFDYKKLARIDCPLPGPTPISVPKELFARK